MKKVLVVGCGLDVLDKERGAFINSYFDDVIIMKHAVLFINEFIKYTGTPTAILPPFIEWCKYEYYTQLDEWKQKEFKEWHSNERLEPLRKRICECIYNSYITKIMLFPYDKKYFYPFNFPLYNIYNKDISIIDTININNTIHTRLPTAGLVTLKYAIRHYDKIYYMGFDGETRCHIVQNKNRTDISYTHYYSEYGSFIFPWNYTRNIPNHGQYFDIKILEKKYRISHIDTIYE